MADRTGVGHPAADGIHGGAMRVVESATFSLPDKGIGVRLAARFGEIVKTARDKIGRLARGETRHGG